MLKAKFLKTKAISAIIIIIGLIISSVLFITLTKKEQEHSVDEHTYSFYNPFSGEMNYNSGSDIGELSILEFAFSKYMDKAIWIITASCFAAITLFAVVFFALFFNEELIVTETEISGKAIRGKNINYTYDRITAVKKSLFKGITIITAGQKKEKIKFVKNQAEIIEAIDSKIKKDSKKESSVVIRDESIADQIKKFKELNST